MMISAVDIIKDKRKEVSSKNKTNTILILSGIKMKIKLVIFSCLNLFIFTILLQPNCQAVELNIMPSLETGVIYDDNLDFSDKDEIDDFGAFVIPGLTLKYATELLQVSLIGNVDIIKYFDETQFDRTNQLYGFDGRYRMLPRWTIAGNSKYRKDETIDSQLEETGQAFERDRVTTYDVGGGLFYQLTELSEIGYELKYRKRDYSDDIENTDYDLYTFSLPYKKQFANELDTVTFTPAYTVFNSDGGGDTKDYRLVAGWIHRISETLTSEINGGLRYTDIENNRGQTDTKWGYLGKLGLVKKTETFTGEISLSRDIQANSDAEIIEVNRLLLEFDKQLLERFGFNFYGSGYYSNTDSSEEEDEKTVFFELKPSLYFRITENHTIELTYNYQNEKEYDRPGNPTTQRNAVWLGFVFRFPKKWDH